MASTNRLFTSSTAVYAQDSGEWVDENSETAPQRFNGQVMLEAEAVALAAPRGQVLRLGGLYGPGRNRLIRLARERVACQAEPPRYTNRIHCQDAARAAHHLLLRADANEELGVVLGVDSDPAPEHVVRDWLTAQLSLAPSPRDNAGRGQNKRCRNARHAPLAQAHVGEALGREVNALDKRR